MMLRHMRRSLYNRNGFLHRLYLTFDAFIG
jgi:hypothetical protein